MSIFFSTTEGRMNNKVVIIAQIGELDKLCSVTI